MKLSKLPRRGFLIAAAFVGISGAVACAEPIPIDLATMMIYLPGNDTVFVDVASGQVMSGPIEMFGDISFSAEFFALNGTPDGRITESSYRLDVTPVNPSLITFTRANGFAGDLAHLGQGTTQLNFALFSFETMDNVFNWPVDVVLY